MDSALEWGARVFRDKAAGQTSLFGEPGGGPSQPLSPSLPIVSEFPSQECLNMEKELLGIYLSGHPLEAVNEQLGKLITVSCREVNEGVKVGDVVLGGIITSLRRRVTKSGKMMAFITLEDLTGVVETVILPETYEKCTAALADTAVVILRGRAEIDDRWRNEQEGASQMKVMVEGIAALNDPEAVQTLLSAPASTRGRRGQSRGSWQGKSNGTGTNGSRAAAPPRENGNGNGISAPKEIHIRLPETTDRTNLDLLKKLISQYRGQDRVYLHIAGQDTERCLHLTGAYGIAYTDAFSLAVQGIFGEGAVWVGKGRE